VEGLSKGLALELAPFGIHVTAVAPGLFSTDFLSADSYTVSSNAIEDYKQTASGRMKDRASQQHGKQPGDPSKLAAVVINLANLENPPVDLPVGRDAIALYRSNAARWLAEITKWEELSSSTDHKQDSKNEKKVENVHE
jgi:NAD(P)-dependent dehydrogenase (short-subunit alcohol dehydrogenase family)